MKQNVHSTGSLQGVTPVFCSLIAGAHWAAVSTRTMRRWIELGLPKYQAGPGGKVLIKPADIEKFLTRPQALQVDIKALVE